MAAFVLAFLARLPANRHPSVRPAALPAQVTPFDCPVCRMAVQMFVSRLQVCGGWFCAWPTAVQGLLNHWRVCSCQAELFRCPCPAHVRALALSSAKAAHSSTKL